MTKRIGVGTLLPFWVFILFFKFAASLHYTLLAPLGARVLPLWIVGLLIGGGCIFQMFFDVPVGYLLDRVGYRRLLIWCVLAILFGSVVLFFGLTILTFVISLAAATVAWLIYNPGSNAYILSSAPREIAGRFIGFSHAVSSLGVVLASIVLALVVNSSGLYIGIVLAVLAVVALAAIIFAPREKASVHIERKIQRHTFYIRRHFLGTLLRSLKKLNPASSLLIGQNFVSGLFYAAIWFVVPLIIASDHATSLYGISLSVFDLSIVVLGSFLGKLADKMNRRHLIFMGLLLFALTGMVIGFWLNGWFLLLGFLATTGDEMSAVSLWAWLDNLDVKHNEDGAINGAIVFFSDFGWAIGPILAGLLYEGLGAAWTITSCALPLFVLWFLSVLLVWPRWNFTKSLVVVGQPEDRDFPKRERSKR